MTYADVGGCKEQIEKLREVVELPLLEVRIALSGHTSSLTSAARTVRKPRYRAAKGRFVVWASRNWEDALREGSSKPDGQYLHSR